MASRLQNPNDLNGWRTKDCTTKMKKATTQTSKWHTEPPRSPLDLILEDARVIRKLWTNTKRTKNKRPRPAWTTTLKTGGGGGSLLWVTELKCQNGKTLIQHFETKTLAKWCNLLSVNTKVLHPARNTFVHDNKHMCALFFSPPMHILVFPRLCLKPQLGSRSTARSKPAKMESAGQASRCARGTCRPSGAGSTWTRPCRVGRRSPG